MSFVTPPRHPELNRITRINAHYRNKKSILGFRIEGNEVNKGVQVLLNPDLQIPQHHSPTRENFIGSEAQTHAISNISTLTRRATFSSRPVAFDVRRKTFDLCLRRTI